MEDCKYKLSIIIPMYNAERYIGACLDSIVSSDLSKGKYEIVVINDGSKDNSANIAKEYVEKYSNISYLSQENQGQSTARNNGIKSCHGEFVWCVDADDKLDSSKLHLIFEELEKYKTVEILAVQLQRVTESGKKISIECSQPAVTHNVIMSGRDAVVNGYSPSSICALIAKRSLFMDNEIFFVPGITHQDVELTYRLMPCAREVIFSDIIPYIYIHHPNSTSKSINPKKKIKYLSDEIIVIQSFKDLAERYEGNDHELYTTIKSHINGMHLGMVLNLFRNKRVWSPLGINKVVIENMKAKGYYPLKGNFGSWKKNLLSKILNIELLIE